MLGSTSSHDRCRSISGGVMIPLGTTRSAVQLTRGPLEFRPALSLTPLDAVRRSSRWRGSARSRASARSRLSCARQEYARAEPAARISVLRNLGGIIGRSFPHREYEFQRRGTRRPDCGAQQDCRNGGTTARCARRSARILCRWSAAEHRRCRATTGSFDAMAPARLRQRLASVTIEPPTRPQ